jgi:hypothetical protein
MCEQCVELETKITHYRTFLRQGFDPLTEHRIKELIADLERQKHFMHHRIKIRRRALPPTPWKWEVYDDRKFKTVTGSPVA